MPQLSNAFYAGTSSAFQHTQHALTHPHTHSAHTHFPTHSHTLTPTHTHAHTHTHMHTHTPLLSQTNTLLHTVTQTRTHAHTLTHSHTHTVLTGGILQHGDTEGSAPFSGPHHGGAVQYQTCLENT